MEFQALKSILAIKGLELPEDVEAANPVSEFVSERLTEILPDNEMADMLRDLAVNKANDQPMAVLNTIQRFNSAVVEFSQKDRTNEYIKELNADPDE